MSCFIISDCIDHGGQVSFFLQLVKTPLLIIVIFSSPFEETPSILGSFSVVSNIFLWILILVSFAMNFLSLRFIIPSSKKNLSLLGRL